MLYSGILFKKSVLLLPFWYLFLLHKISQTLKVSMELLCAWKHLFVVQQNTFNITDDPWILIPTLGSTSMININECLLHCWTQWKSAQHFIFEFQLHFFPTSCVKLYCWNNLAFSCRKLFWFVHSSTFLHNKQDVTNFSRNVFNVMYWTHWVFLVHSHQKKMKCVSQSYLFLQKPTFHFLLPFLVWLFLAALMQIMNQDSFSLEKPELLLFKKKKKKSEWIRWEMSWSY